MNRWDVNARDSLGMKPLIWAAGYGHDEVVRLLLRGGDVEGDHWDVRHGRTALSWAAGNGHEGVVKLFLRERLFNLRGVSDWRSEAVRAMGFFFSGKSVNPDSPDMGGQTPLSWAMAKHRSRWLSGMAMRE